MLVFAFGAIAIVSLQGRAVRDVNDAQFRAEAIQLVEALIAEMRASSQATLYAMFDSREDGAGYRAFLDRASRLPGVAVQSNAPDVRVGDGPSAGSRRVDVTVFWRAPGEPTAHRHSASAVLKGP